MRPLVHFPHEFHNFISASHRPACRLTSHLLMTRMMPFSRSKPLILKSSQQNFHNELLPFKSDYSLQNVDSQRNLHRLFAHASMDWAQPIPAFQRQVIVNPHRSGGEINQVFDDITNHFHQRRDRLAASPPYSRLSTIRFFQFPLINFNSCERNRQQIQIYCSL